MKISSFTTWLCEGDPPLKFDWRAGLPGSQAGYPKGSLPRYSVIRLTTECGKEAWLRSDMGEIAFDLVRRRFHLFLGENPLLTEHLWHRVWEVDRIEEINVRAFGYLDQLAWDLKSRLAGLPAYQMLGGNNPTIPVYASTVTYPTLSDYERHIRLCMDVGFTAFKLHAWGDVKADKELSTALRKWTGPDAVLMFDGSAGWDYVDALEVGRALEGEGFLWYEEPMREFHLGSYKKLCDALDIPVLAAETSDGIHWNAASWIEAGALDMLRTSAMFKGGMTGAIKVAHLAESFGMRAQVHGMGMANAHICAAIPNNDYYEQIVVNEDHIKGLSSLEELPIKDGVLNVSDQPGLCEPYDAETLDRIALETHQVKTSEG